MSFIEIKNITLKKPNGSLILDNINLTINEKSFVVICGENGSGKSTLVKNLNGLVFPDEGKITIDNGLEVKKNLSKARQIVGMVFQHTDSQIVGETVYDDIAFGLENLSLKNDEIEKKVSNILEEFNLTNVAEVCPHYLSGGEKKKLCIASILVMEPKIIVFDEPFTSLDFYGVKKILKEIVKLHKNGHTIIVITHNLEEIINYTDRLIVMNKGKIVMDGKPKNLLNKIENFGVKKPVSF